MEVISEYFGSDYLRISRIIRDSEKAKDRTCACCFLWTAIRLGVQRRKPVIPLILIHYESLCG